MKPKIISITKIDNLKYKDSQLYPGIYTSCPCCNGDIVYGMISCPDGREGCCVAHYGFGCISCKTVYDVKYELPDDGKPKEPFRVFEEIGIGMINTNGLKKLKLSSINEDIVVLGPDDTNKPLLGFTMTEKIGIGVSSPTGFRRILNKIKSYFSKKSKTVLY